MQEERIASEQKMEENSQNERKANQGSSQSRRILLTLWGIVNFLAALSISLQTPLYSAEAEENGPTGVDSGYLFGTCLLVILISSPLLGKYMSSIGVKKMFRGSIKVMYLSLVGYGSLGLIRDRTWFITLSFLCTFFQALGTSGLFTASVTMMCCEFPESKATMFGVLHTFISLGFTMGPVLGDPLYSVNGFSLPFFTVAICFMVSGCFSVLILPAMEETPIPCSKVDTSEGYWIGSILKVPAVLQTELTLFSSAFSLGFVATSLTLYTQILELTSLESALLLLIHGGVTALTAPVFGFVCDRVDVPLGMNLAGNMFIFVAFLFISSPLLPWSLACGLFIQGAGISTSLVSAFTVGLNNSVKHGLSDTIATYAAVFGTWQFTVALGVLTGFSLSNLLSDTVVFRDACLLFLATSFVSAISIVMYVCGKRSSSLSRMMDHAQETEPFASSSGRYSYSSVAIADMGLRALINAPDGPLFSVNDS